MYNEGIRDSTIHNNKYHLYACIELRRKMFLFLFVIVYSSIYVYLIMYI